MTDLAKQNYELAFHISSNLDEAEVQKTRQELERIITSNGGVVSFAKDPERFRLSYPIKHQSHTFFGYFNFNLESIEESVFKIRDEIRLNPAIVRFLILKLQSESKMKKEDLVRRIAMAEKRRARLAKGTDKPTSSKVEAPKMEEAEIEKKLEEIIDKL